jgi:putative DNA primase/helicase
MKRGRAPQQTPRQTPNLTTEELYVIIAEDEARRNGQLLDNIPEELRRRSQWVVWKLERRRGELTKIPYDPITGKRAKSNDLMTWRPFRDALEALDDGDYHGIGFVFCSGDPYTGIDLDDVRDPESGAIEAWALEIVEMVCAYAEISPSGRGLHIVVRGELPNSRRGNVEVYSTRRFFTMTGRRV